MIAYKNDRGNIVFKSLILVNNTFLTSFTHKNGVISDAISGVNRDELEAKEKIILSEI